MLNALIGLLATATLTQENLLQIQDIVIEEMRNNPPMDLAAVRYSGFSDWDWDKVPNAQCFRDLPEELRNDILISDGLDPDTYTPGDLIWDATFWGYNISIIVDCTHIENAAFDADDLSTYVASILYHEYIHWQQFQAIYNGMMGFAPEEFVTVSEVSFLKYLRMWNLEDEVYDCFAQLEGEAYVATFDKWNSIRSDQGGGVGLETYKISQKMKSCQPGYEDYWSPWDGDDE